MQVLVILAVLGASFALPQHFLRDTPEVVAERQRFFQLYNAAAAAAAAAPDHNATPRQAAIATHQPAPVQTNFKWRGPVAATVPAHVNGQFAPVSNTAEVAAATREFNRAYEQALRATAPHRLSAFVQANPQPAPVPVHANRWVGPVAATIPAGLPGSSNVRNTAEVSAAIADFTRAYNAAVVSTTGHQAAFAPAQTRFAAPAQTRFAAPAQTRFAAPVQTRFAAHVSNHIFAAPAHVAPQRWTGPFASNIPAGLPGAGTQVRNTPEVEAAIAEFTRAYNSVARRG